MGGAISNGATPKVVCVGISVLDLIFEVDRLPEARIKHYARTRRETTGGIAANATRAVIRLGGRAALVSRVGDDLPGRAIREELSREGIDTTGLATLSDVRTSLSAVMIDPTGERMLVNDTDPRLLRGLEGLALTSFADADVVMADTRWADGAVIAMRQAKARGIPGLLDFDRVPDHPGWEPLLELSTHIAFGKEGLASFAGTDEIESGLRRARRRSSAWLAVTAGVQGVYWLDGDAVRQVPGFAVEAVDTLAAGDVFHGALALALAERQPIEAGLRFANAAAAVKCARAGGGAVAPTRAEMDGFLKERR